MCTTGVVRLSDDEYLLFKNKDFGRTHFDDRVILEPDVFGVEGITTWAGSDPDADVFSGFSIGAAGDGFLCCDSNVRTMDDHESYDDLVELAVREGGVDAAIRAIRQAVADRPHVWANLIMIDAGSAAVVEVRSSTVEVTRVGERAARTNHHVALGAHPEDDDTVTSAARLEAAMTRIGAVSAVEDVFPLQRSHDHGGTGICNHALHQTVYSYVLHRRGGHTTLSVAQGRPCEDPERHHLVVPIGRDWSSDAARSFRERYPSDRALATPGR